MTKETGEEGAEGRSKVGSSGPKMKQGGSKEDKAVSVGYCWESDEGKALLESIANFPWQSQGSSPLHHPNLDSLYTFIIFNYCLC